MPGAEGQPPHRTTFRPPWVKDRPSPIPIPTVPWTVNSRTDSKSSLGNSSAFTQSVPKSLNTKLSEPMSIKSNNRMTTEAMPSQSKGNDIASKSIVSTSSKIQKNHETSRAQDERQDDIKRSISRNDQFTISKDESTMGAATVSKIASRTNMPPPPPPRPPPPPARTVIKNLPPLSKKQLNALEMLRSRPRKRPDWACMMKEVENGKKLRHVVCNDRSAPLIERVITKITDDPAGDAHFVFNSEKTNVHNKLLKQIQEGVQLKSVKTNDRSKPMLEGLRKFRRQLTLEEQIQKAEQAPVEETVADEMDDIDAVRDDLQSTKQMLAMELRKKETLERENKRLQARILNLEIELERECSRKTLYGNKHQQDSQVPSLGIKAVQSEKDEERIQNEFAAMADERDQAKNCLEEMKKMYANLEKRMKAGIALAGCPSAKDVARIASQKSMEKVETEETNDEEKTSDTDSTEDDDPIVVEEKRQKREIKLIKAKIKNVKEKTVNSKKERQLMKDQIKQQQKLLKEEKRKFIALQREVDKMAKLMADADYEETEVEEEQDETESEEESESEESKDDDTESEDDNKPLEKRKNKLQYHVKRHEGRLSALRKGNNLLKTQVDKLKDDVTKQREQSISLQEDLDSVLAELG